MLPPAGSPSTARGIRSRHVVFNQWRDSIHACSAIDIRGTVMPLFPKKGISRY